MVVASVASSFQGPGPGIAPLVPSGLILAHAEDGHKCAVRARMRTWRCLTDDADRLRSSIASPTKANPPRNAFSVRYILLPEVATERLFLGDDLHERENDHEQRWNKPRVGAAEPDRPSDQQQQQSQIHRIAAEAKNAVRDKSRGLARVDGIDSRSDLTKTHERSYRDGDSDGSHKPAESVPPRADPLTERHPVIQCPHEPGSEQHQGGWRNPGWHGLQSAPATPA